jgi:hypothetical protein
MIVRRPSFAAALVLFQIFNRKRMKASFIIHNALSASVIKGLTVLADIIFNIPDAIEIAGDNPSIGVMRAVIFELASCLRQVPIVAAEIRPPIPATLLFRPVPVIMRQDRACGQCQRGRNHATHY